MPIVGGIHPLKTHYYWQPFTPLAPTPTVTGISDSLEEVTIKIPSGFLADPRPFVRVKVTE